MTTPTNPFTELNRLFERMRENVEEAARVWDTASSETAPHEITSVNVDLEDRDEELVLTADLPGFEKEDIDVRAIDHTLRIEAEHQEESEEETNGRYLRRERRRASVAWSIPLPNAIETDDVSATYNNGILTVRLPKSEPTADGTEIAVE